MNAEPPLTEGPVFLGQVEKENPAPQEDAHPGGRFPGGKYWMILIGLSAACVVGLTVGALLHRQWTCLPWIAVSWAEYPLLSLLHNLKQKRHRPDEHVLAVRDWLRRQTERGAFGAPLTEGGATVWLTGEGLYSQTHYLPWKQFSHVSLDQRFSMRDSALVHRLTLRLRWSRAVEKWWVIAWTIFSALCLIVGAAAFCVCLQRYGLRDDVLALLFALVVSLSASIAFTLRFLKERSRGRRGLAILLCERLILSDDLRDFFRHCLPAGVDLT